MSTNIKTATGRTVQVQVGTARSGTEGKVRLFDAEKARAYSFDPQALFAALRELGFEEDTRTAAEKVQEELAELDEGTQFTTDRGFRYIVRNGEAVLISPTALRNFGKSYAFADFTRSESITVHSAE